MQKLKFAGREWQRDLPDPRDYSLKHKRVAELIGSVNDANVPSAVDLRDFFPCATEKSGAVASVARACVDTVEYFERRVYGRMRAFSASFLQYGTSRLLGTDTYSCALDFRTTIKTMIRFGLPAENLWPDRNALDNSAIPDALVYGAARRYTDLVYVRLDTPEQTSDRVLDHLRFLVSRGIPVMFGMAVPSSVNRCPDIEFRPTIDSFPCGHAMIAVGYDDDRRHAARGAVRVRAQWGKNWGENGCGWLPYSYITHHLTADFWAILKPQWLWAFAEDGVFAKPEAPTSQ